jgi:NAD(P)-dependent dehydrogenase (short-subunit alcohol dehydrogenase family)
LRAATSRAEGRHPRPQRSTTSTACPDGCRDGWGDRGARINSISPGTILTPLASDEKSGPGSTGYQAMIDQSAAGRVGTADEVATVAAFLLGPDAAFITGTDLLMDGGVIAALRAGRINVNVG